MTRRMLINAALVLGLLAVPSLALAGADTRLLGTWESTAMVQNGKEMPTAAMGLTVTIKFTKTGFVGTMKMGKRSESESGTWSTSGDKLHTTRAKKNGKANAGKKETVTYKITGSQLMIITKGGTFKLKKLSKKK